MLFNLEGEEWDSSGKSEFVNIKQCHVHFSVLAANCEINASS